LQTLTADMRTAVAKAVAEIAEGIAVDMGGLDALSARQRELIEQAAVAGAMLRDVAEKYLNGEHGHSDEFARLSRSMRLLLDEARAAGKPRAKRATIPQRLQTSKPERLGLSIPQRLRGRPGQAA